MEETKRISSLFSNLYNGNPWLDITLKGTLSAIAAEKAAIKHDGINSIWEITNHLIDWRRNVLQRVNNVTIISPEHNYFLPVADTSEQAWQETLRQLELSQDEWISFLSQMHFENLSDVYPANGHTHYEHIHGIIQHDAYHLGQIVLIAKHLV